VVLGNLDLVGSKKKNLANVDVVAKPKDCPHTYAIERLSLPG
jgi:hypothetical protein